MIKVTRINSKPSTVKLQIELSEAEFKVLYRLTNAPAANISAVLNEGVTNTEYTLTSQEVFEVFKPIHKALSATKKFKTY